MTSSEALDLSNEFDFSAALSSVDLAAICNFNLFSLLLHEVVVSTLALSIHEVGILKGHLLFKVAERVVTFAVIGVIHLVLLHFRHVVEFVVNSFSARVHHVNRVEFLWSVVPQSLGVILHSADVVLLSVSQFETHLIGARAKPTLEHVFDLSNCLGDVESDLLQAHHRLVRVSRVQLQSV